MTEMLRRSGIPLVGNIPWGTHFCHFYEAKTDLLDILIPYFETGLNDHEFCIWVVFDPLNEEEAKNSLRTAFPGAEKHLAAGDIEIVPHTQWYLEGGDFDLQRVIDRWQEKLAQALAKGYDGMRVNGNEAWLTPKNWRDFAEYEKKLDEIISDSKMIVLCTYPLVGTTAAEFLDVARTHEFAIARRNGNWEILRTPELKHAKAEIEALIGELELRVAERTRELAVTNEELRKEITERKAAEDALQESEERYRLLVDEAQEGILIAQNGIILFANPKTIEIFSRTREQLLSTLFIEFFHPDDRERIYRLHMRRLKGEQFQTRYSARILTGEGDVKSVEIGSTTIFWQGNPAALVFVTDATERVRMEEALKESEAKYRTLVEESFDGMFIHKGSKILFANSRLQEMLGYSSEEMKDLDYWMIYHPDYQELIRERGAARLLGEHSVAQYEVKLQRKDGSSFDGELSARAVTVEGQSGVLVWVRDVSERKRSEEARRLLATAVEQAAEAIVVTDRDGNIQYVNPAFETITGYTPEEVVGRHTRLLKSGEHDNAFYRNMWETLERGQVWTGRFINRRKDGKLCHEQATISPVRDGGGQIVHFVAVKREITEELRLGQQLVQAQKMEAIGTLAGGIAHDFNNLLQVILGYSELMLQDRQPEETDYSDLQKILHAARSGTDLVRRLLTFSRKMEYKPIPLNLNRQIVQVEKLLRRTIPKMIDIQMNLSDDVAEVYADPTQIEQILMNLAVNARDAMPDKGRLTIATRNTTVDEQYCKLHVGATVGEYVMLTVSDTGHGMTKDTIDHIFEPFYTTKELGHGTGLGLAMVYGIVRQHGGFISCYSEVGHGTTFAIYLPAIESHLETDVADSGVMPAFGTETILLADDEEFIRDLGYRILTNAGYRVLTATNGKEALAVFEKEKKDISLAILDLVMPEMGGKECLEELRKIDPHLKVLIASGYPGDPSIKDSVEASAQGFAGKPFRMKELLRQVRRILDES